MTNQIDLNSFSAKKYKTELYQLRLNSYLEKSEDFEESDFIESEQKYFESCYNSVDENNYNANLVDWYELKDDIPFHLYYDLEPQIDGETYQYFSNNRSEQERLIKTFSLILQFLSGTEKTQVKDTPKPPQFKPAIIEEVKEENKTQQSESLLKNPHQKIFKNDIGFTIFTKMVEIYKDDAKHDLANFSFLFYAMEKDFLVCAGADFIKFLSTCNIIIEKIDPRQSGKNKKTTLYEAIKDSLQ